MKILCIGNIAFDCTISGKNFIEEGVRNSFDNAIFSTGGPTSNAASVVAKYGNDTYFYGQVGNDYFGKHVLNEMKRENINLDNVNISNNRMTPLSFVIITEAKKKRTICSIRSKNDFTNPIIEKIDYKSGYDFILTDGKYPKDTLKLIQKNPDAISIIDAGRVNDGVVTLCKFVKYIICSEDFAEGITDIKFDGSKKKDELIFKKLQSVFPKQNLAITVGARGYIYSNNGEVILKPAYEPESPVIDTNCAGDIFHGAFTHAFANGYSYEDSLEFANITASISTTKRGGRTSVPELNEVEEIMNNKRGKKYVKEHKNKDDSV